MAQEDRDDGPVDNQVLAVEEQSNSGETDHPHQGAAAFGIEFFIRLHCEFLALSASSRAGLRAANGAGRRFRVLAESGATVKPGNAVVYVVRALGLPRGSIELIAGPVCVVKPTITA
jgi:hypothetical protein